MPTSSNDHDGFVRRHRVAIYFAVAFAISWGGVLAVVLPSGLPGRGGVLESLSGHVFVAMAAGPMLAGVGLTFVVEGWAGLQRLGHSMAAWRCSPVDYLCAALAAPAIALVVLGALCLISPDFTPGAFGPGGLSLIAMGAGVGLAAGFFEEIGWTGFALRNLLTTGSVLAAGLMVGLLHGLWHLLAGYWGEGLVYGIWYVPYFLMAWIVGLTGLRVLIAWLVSRTQSTLIAQIAHASYTGGLMVLWPPAATPAQNVLWTAIFALALFGVALLISSQWRGQGSAIHRQGARWNQHLGPSHD